MKSYPRLVECFDRQRGLCIWCGVDMFLANTHMEKHEPLRATLEHAYSKLSPVLRSKHGNKLFAACYTCNSTRGRFDVILQSRGIDVSDIWIIPTVERLSP